jgi:hypothetical protein
MPRKYTIRKPNKINMEARKRLTTASKHTVELDIRAIEDRYDVGSEAAAVIETEYPEGRTVFSDSDVLDGFWRGENATPSPVRLVKGDVDKFNADLERCKGRVHGYLGKLERTRHSVIHSYPEELLLVDKWCDESVSSNKDTEDE